MLRGFYEFEYEYEYEFPPEHHHHQQLFPGGDGLGSPNRCPYHHQPAEVREDPVYGSDEFRMYAFKIKRCSRTRSHDWTECPFAHRGEKAQRRDPRKFDYCAVACPAFRNGRCLKGDTCEFAHGVFEYWLHPARYRTRPCNAGRFCQRKVCFFAHSPDQLRSETKYRLHPAVYRVRVPDRVVGEGVISKAAAAAVGATPPPSPAAQYMIMGSPTLEGVSEFLKSLRSLKISEDGDDDHSGIDLPEIEWVSDLVEGEAVA